MVLNRKVILNEARDVALLAAVGLIMTVSGLTCGECVENTRLFWIVGSFTSLMWILLWKGNSNLVGFATRRISWLEEPVKKFFYGFLLTVVYTMGIMYLLGAFYKSQFGIDLTKGIIYSVIITIIISLFMHGRSFLQCWKESTIAAERLQRESIAARYENLRNQVNPHFLFNSFNALSNLVYEDPDKAVRFIKQLSEVYRYVLDTRDREVVPLSQELAFLESYLYLQKIRFGEKLKVSVNIGKKDTCIAPLALQMLIENAIKHNIVSEDDPLAVDVGDAGGFIVVSNNLQRKVQLGEPSAGVGLENICRRYEFLSGTKVIVKEEDRKFIVMLPILNCPAE